MKEHPIIFNGDMVYAIRDGLKTQTRRPFRIQPQGSFCGLRDSLGYPASEGKTWAGFRVMEDRSPIYYRCPFGSVGDRLWVRESFGFSQVGSIVYRADVFGKLPGKNCGVGKWIPSIHMPKEYSRITLEIKEIRVHRLGEISRSAAWSEGVKHLGPVCYAWKNYTDSQHPCGTPESSFATLWDSIYGSYSPEQWVWGCVFKVIHGLKP